jgi:deazaflavin-dependent oxidoreductase (nitroreductase family)
VRLYAFEDGDRLIVVGSWAGKPVDPAWARNLRGEPRATLQHGKDVREVHASEVTGKERERLWRLAAAAFPLYETYQRRTSRRIPVFILEPVGER